MKIQRILLIPMLILALAICYISDAHAAQAPKVYNASDVPLADYVMMYVPTPEEIVMMAKTGWQEMRGVASETEQAAVYWNIFNRLDDPRFPETVAEIITDTRFGIQYVGWDPDNPVVPELLDLAYDVRDRWVREKVGETDVGRVLPKEYVYFHGDGVRNHFSKTEGGKAWTWELPSPYES